MNQPLAETVFWIAAAACLIAEVAILRSTFAARYAQRSEMVPASSQRSELAWAIIPALALGAVLIVTWQRIEARQMRMEMMDHSGMPHSMQIRSAQPALPRR